MGKETNVSFVTIQTLKGSNIIKYTIPHKFGGYHFSAFQNHLHQLQIITGSITMKNCFLSTLFQKAK